MKTEQQSADHPAFPPALAVIVVWAVCASAITWFVLDPLKYVFAAAIPASMTPLDVLHVVRSNINLMQISLILLWIAITLFLAAIELRRRDISAILIAQSWPMLVVFLVFLAWLGHSYFGYGYLLSGDTVAHISMITTRMRAILADTSPYWSNFKFFGLPLQVYYAPTTFWPIVWLGIATGNPFVALRVFLFFAYMASGLAMFALAKELRMRRLGACFAGLVYAGSFSHLHLLLFRGAIPMALSLALLPLCFLFLHRFATADRIMRWTWIGLVLVSAALIVNYTPFAIVTAAYMLAFLLCLLLSKEVRWRWSLVWALLAAAIVIGGICAFVLIPAGLNPSDVLPVSVTHLLALRIPNIAYFDNLLVWRAWRTNYPGAAAYLGFVALVFAAVAIYYAARGKLPDGQSRLAIVMLCLLILSLFLRGAHVRDVGFTLCFVALLAGYGVGGLLSRNWAWRSAPAFVLLLFLVDMGSTSVQPIGRTDKGWMDEAGEYLATRNPPGRTIEVEVHDGRLSPLLGGPSILAWHPTEFTIAGHVEMATAAWVFGDLSNLLVALDLSRWGQLAPMTQDLLCLLRVNRIVGIGQNAMGLPEWIAAATPEGPLGRTLQTDCHYQAVFSHMLASPTFEELDPRLDYAPDSPYRRLPASQIFLEKLLSSMAVDRMTGTAAQILVPGFAREEEKILTNDRRGVVINSYNVTADDVRISLTAPSDGFVRLSHAWHSRLDVKLNGKIIETYKDITNFLVSPVVAGANVIEIRPHTDPLQKLGNAVSIASLVFLAAIAIVWGWRDRRGIEGAMPT